ncbi:Pyruvate decarboxylase [Ceratocystis lukuohia]|uniref:Pyruvate decarboxylase n=3 Tax=Ceratocystis TaxID=5157 RepID=A0A0F8D0K2_CERFI|nr:Pyruvate decarboxylase [Ceratocystis platani]PHH53737.1 Pyruvate decarboxylase [Ceratocystis fimbriata CBS 114723]
MDDHTFEKPVVLAEYLFERLKQLGIKSVHGLPGDYNLVALDYLVDSGLQWVGNVNELNAAYAADGYARVAGISALVTTFGVGELSAINGLAGAYSEHIPIVHIVGCPSTISQRSNQLLHHTLGNGDFKVFENMNSRVSCHVANLTDVVTAPAEIDRALRQCVLLSRPVYIMLPTDLTERKVDGARLDVPISTAEPPNDPDTEKYVVDVCLKYIHRAHRPVILVDACAVRHNVIPEVQDLLEKTKFPVFVTPMGKSAVDETHKSYGGVYAGDASKPQVKELVENSDLILSIGSLKSDFNTAGFSYRTSQLQTIDFHSDSIVVRYSQYPGIRMKHVLRKIIDQIDVFKISATPLPPITPNVEEADVSSDDEITQAWFWPRISGFLRENDVVITETGTANFGIWDTRFPRGVKALSQVLWGSIGWAGGAIQGAALAVKDNNMPSRPILFIGDGSIQLTAQEISTCLKHNLKPIIFVICNDGYTIERLIHGETATYNDINTWKYKDLVKVFGGTDANSRTYQVKTRGEVELLFADEQFVAADVLQFVELYMPKMDAPRALVKIAEVNAKNNSRME